MAGSVEVDGRILDKPGYAVATAAEVVVRGPKEPYVSRAGRKLAAALETFAIDARGRVCLDVGASTGGFTDCLLQAGAAKVISLDVGRGQLDYRLRNDPRVIVIEGVNARYLEAGDLPEPVSLVTIDVSFISLTKVVPAVLLAMAQDGELVCLIKPQFEAPRGSVGKGGILRDVRLRAEVVERTSRELAASGELSLVAVADSPVAGIGGNREALAYYRRAPGASGGTTT